MADITVPGIGAVKRGYLYAGIGLVAVLVGVAYYRRAVTRADTVTVDPATGSIGQTGYLNPNPDADGGQVLADATTITTNAQWGSAAQLSLAGAGWDPTYAATALGRYLGRQGLTLDEANAVRAAFALTGMPPVDAPPVIMASTASTPGTPPAPTPGPPPSLPAFVNVHKGTIVNDWVGGLQAAGYNIYWNQIVEMNPGIVDNVTKNTDPRKRVFKYDTAYKVR